jgi:ParB family chromosome partitioning protein
MRKNETRDNIALSDIHVSEDRLRKLDPKLVDTLAESMHDQGQLQPILLRNRRDGYELISGRHRLEAAKKLNKRSIRAEINFNLNNDDMRLAEIDENLIRGELDALERSEHMVKRKELYERKHPETKAGKSQAIGMNKALGHNVVAKLAPTFTKATVAKMGISERSIERDVARGSQTRLGDIRGTSLAKGIELDALAKLEKIDPAKRDALIDLAKAGKKVSARTEVADASEAELDNNISARHIAEIAIAERIAEWTRKHDPNGTPIIVKWLLKQASEDPFSAKYQAARLMSSWNAAGPEARQEFMRRIKEIK